MNDQRLYTGLTRMHRRWLEWTIAGIVAIGCASYIFGHNPEETRSDYVGVPYIDDQPHCPAGSHYAGFATPQGLARCERDGGPR